MNTSSPLSETIVPKCADPVEMSNNETTKKREKERQYLTILMESLQFLARQGIELRCNDDGDDNRRFRGYGSHYGFYIALGQISLDAKKM